MDCKHKEQILTFNENVRKKRSTNRNVNVNMAIYYVRGLKSSIEARKRKCRG